MIVLILLIQDYQLKKMLQLCVNEQQDTVNKQHNYADAYLISPESLAL